MPHPVYISFLFALGACVGSFLNVVVYRLPRDESLVSPPSHCPRCNHKLGMGDNIPVLGWILLRGKCRYCGEKISPRYPIVEFLTGSLFVLFYVLIFIEHQGPFAITRVSRMDDIVAVSRLGDIEQDWPVFGLYLYAVCTLLAASLIDAELYIIPVKMVWLLAGVGLAVHTLVDRPGAAGALSDTPMVLAASAGGGLGLLASIVLLQLGVFPLSFAEGESALEVDKERQAKEEKAARREGREVTAEELKEYTPAEVRREIRKEMLFLLPPLGLAAISVILQARGGAVGDLWAAAAGVDWLNGFLGALFGAMVGGLVVWLTRIIGSTLAGREAMGLGDIHLMFGVGAVVGAGAAVVAFFIAPFFGMAVAVYMLITRKKRELPYGPYLSLASLFVMLFYFPIYNYLRPGLQGLMILVHSSFGGA